MRDRQLLGSGASLAALVDECGDEILGRAIREQRACDLAVVIGRILDELADLEDELILIADPDVVGIRGQLPHRLDPRGGEHALDKSARLLGDDHDRDALLARAPGAAAAVHEHLAVLREVRVDHHAEVR